MRSTANREDSGKGHHKGRLAIVGGAVIATISVAAASLDLIDRTPWSGWTSVGGTVQTSGPTTTELPDSATKPIEEGDVFAGLAPRWTDQPEARSGQPWIEVEFKPGDHARGDVVALVSYPIDGCSGLWTLTEERGMELELQENIYVNPDEFCARNPTIFLTLESDSVLRYRATGPNVVAESRVLAPS